MRSYVYTAKCVFKLNRDTSPPDKVSYETQYCLDTKEIHANDDPDMIAIIAGYNWAKRIALELDCVGTPICLNFTVQLASHAIFEWDLNDNVKLDNLFKMTIDGVYPKANKLQYVK